MPGTYKVYGGWRVFVQKACLSVQRWRSGWVWVIRSRDILPPGMMGRALRAIGRQLQGDFSLSIEKNCKAAQHKA